MSCSLYKVNVILPEFQVSDLLNDTDGKLRSTILNYDFLSLEGGEITSSGEGTLLTRPDGRAGLGFEFFDNFCDSDFSFRF